MNRIRRPCRCPAGLSARASAILAVAAAPAAWRPDPPFPTGWRLPPGWNKHPLLPLGRVAGPVDKVPARIRAHTVAALGLPPSRHRNPRCPPAGRAPAMAAAPARSPTPGAHAEQ